MSNTAVRLAKLAGLFTLSLSVAAPAEAAAASNSFASQFPARVLAAHNAVRTRAGVAPLVWDPALGEAAAAYAQQMAFTGLFAHSKRQARRGTGENLWMGTRGAFSLETMVGNWASEGRVFQRGVFPAVSRTGNWEDVGHYTQIVWPTTTRVGCALASTARTDYLVCRYSPAGNIDGRPVG
jgi:hypothetical protein